MNDVVQPNNSAPNQAEQTQNNKPTIKTAYDDNPDHGSLGIKVPTKQELAKAKNEVSTGEKEIKENQQASKPEQKETKQWKYKACGKEYEVPKRYHAWLETASQEDRNEFLKELSKATAFNKEAEERSKIQKQSEELLRLFKNNPEMVMKQLGIDPDEWSTQRLAAKLENDLLDPKERELKETKARLQKYEQEQKAKEEAEKAERDHADRKSRMEAISKEIESAMQEAGLDVTRPGSAVIGNKIIQYMIALSHKGVSATAKEVLPLVIEDYASELSELNATLSGDKFEDFYSRTGTLERLRQLQLEQMKKKGLKEVGGKQVEADEIQTAEIDKPKKRKQIKKHLSRNEWRKLVDNRLNNSLD